MIEVGQAAPELRLRDTTGAGIDLRNYRGESDVLIYIMRNTGCPMCNRHVQQLATHAGEYAQYAVTVLVAVPDDQNTAARWAAKKQLPFPVVTGARDTPHAGLGLGRKMFGSMQQSGTVLLDRAGVVRYLNIVTMPTGGYTHRAVLEAIQDLHRTRAGT
jgi:peroxiredoxin